MELVGTSLKGQLAAMRYLATRKPNLYSLRKFDSLTWILYVNSSRSGSYFEWQEIHRVQMSAAPKSKVPAARNWRSV